MSLKNHKITDTHVTIRTELGRVTLTREEFQEIATEIETVTITVTEMSIDLDPWTDAEGAIS